VTEILTSGFVLFVETWGEDKYLCL